MTFAKSRAIRHTPRTFVFQYPTRESNPVLQIRNLPCYPSHSQGRELRTGDALIAGTLAGLGQDMDLFDSTRLGQACAVMALESAASVPDALTMQAAMTRARLRQA